MAEFISAVTTDLGIALSADLLVGERLEFTKLVTGSGIYAEEERERSRLQKSEALKEFRQEFPFSSIEKVTDSCVLLKSLLSNKDLTQGYRMTEIGVYARKPGEDGDGILYSIAVAVEADYFPPYNGLAAVEIIEEYYITVSDAANVTIQTDRGACLLLEDFLKYKEETDKRFSDIWEKLLEYKEKLDELEIKLEDCVIIEPGGNIYAGNPDAGIGNRDVLFIVEDMEETVGGGKLYIGGASEEIDIKDVLLITSEEGEKKGGLIYVGAEDKQIKKESILLVTEEVDEHEEVKEPFLAVSYDNFVLSSTPPDGVPNWGMLAGDLTVSEELPKNARFWNKLMD